MMIQPEQYYSLIKETKDKERIKKVIKHIDDDITMLNLHINLLKETKKAAEKKIGIKHED